MAGAIPADVHLAVAPAPVNIRDAAARVTRAGTHGVRFVCVHVFTGFQEVLHLEEHALDEGDVRSATLLQRIGGDVAVLLFSFGIVPDPDGVVLVRFPIVPAFRRPVEVVGIPIAREELLAGLVRAVGRDSLGDDDEPVEAVFLLGDFEPREVDVEAEALLVEGLPVDERVTREYGWHERLVDDLLERRTVADPFLCDVGRHVVREYLGDGGCEFAALALTHPVTGGADILMGRLHEQFLSVAAEAAVCQITETSRNVTFPIRSHIIT